MRRGKRRRGLWLLLARHGKDMFVGCRRCLAGSCVHANRKDTQGTHLDNARTQTERGEAGSVVDGEREREREIGARHAGNEKPQSQRSSTGSIRQATEREMSIGEGGEERKRIGKPKGPSVGV